MKIRSVATRVEAFALTRPYTITFRSIDSVENVIVRIETEDGQVGLGAASPEPHVTGETREACLALAGKYLGGTGVFAIFALTIVVVALMGRLLARNPKWVCDTSPH